MSVVDHLRAVYRSVVAEVRFYYWFYSYQRLLDKRWLSFASWWSGAALGAFGAFGAFGCYTFDSCQRLLDKR